MTLAALQSSWTLARPESSDPRPHGPTAQSRQCTADPDRILAECENLAPNARTGYLRTTMGDQALIGTVLAERWEVLDALGRGGMGAVYRARHVHLGTDVAIKVLRNTARLDASEIARFYRESRLIGSLQHDHVVRVQDTGTTPAGDLYFVMEYLRGPNLHAVLKSDGPFPWARTRAILLQVCDALAAMHDRGVIHRDLKPHNIVFDPRPGRPDFVKLLDFGIAKPTGEDLTQAGLLLGTPKYMAPEYLCGAAPDCRIDIYALGVIMFELLTGQQPTANTAANASTLQAGGVPLAAQDVILRALARDPRYRFDDARAFAAALSAVPEEPPVDVDETTRVRVPSPFAELAPPAKAAPAPRPTVSSSSVTARRPDPILPIPPHHTQIVTRREDGPVGLLDTDDTATSPSETVSQPAPMLPGPVNDARAIARPGDEAIFAFSPNDPDKTVQVPDDPTYFQKHRTPAGVVPLVLRALPPVARARDDSPDPARPGASESAAPASMSVSTLTAPMPARAHGATRRIATVMFGLGSLGVLAAMWPMSSPPPPLSESTPELVTPSDPTPPVVENPQPEALPNSGIGEPPKPPIDDKPPPPVEPEQTGVEESPPIEPTKPPPKRTGAEIYTAKRETIARKIRECGQQGIAGESIQLEITIHGASGKARVAVKGPAILFGEPPAVCTARAIERLKFETFDGDYTKKDNFSFGG